MVNGARALEAVLRPPPASPVRRPPKAETRQHPLSATALTFALRDRRPVETEQLRVSRPNDRSEETADQLATGSGQDRGAGSSRPARQPPDVGGAEEVLGSAGRPLESSVQAEADARFGTDFSRVRIHDDATAAQAAAAMGASAFTAGRHIVFGQGAYTPGTAEGRDLVRHELAHVHQQAAAGKASLGRRLLLTGTGPEIADFLAMSDRASGLRLVRDPLTNEVTATGSVVTTGFSPSFSTRLAAIIAAPLQDAEIHVGANQPGVDIGAFPIPSDLTGSRVQNVDMDDINAMEAGAPGIGAADLLHEIVENFEAHARAPVPGVDLFPPAHATALQAEAEVVRDIVGSGNRVAQASNPIGTNIVRIAEDYDTYYVLSTLTSDPVTNRFARSDAAFAPKALVVSGTIDNFGSSSDVVPAPAAAIPIAVAVAANPLATVRIEGFTDSTGTVADNLDLGERRATNAAALLTAVGIDPGRINVVGRGETGFVAPNDTAAHKSLNRRVVFTVTRPGP